MLLKAEGLSKTFGSLVAVDHVDLKVPKGTVCSIIGPNGAGKTTLFDIIFGIFPPSSGKTYFQGKDITKLKACEVSHLGIGRSFQGYNLFTNLTVFENIRIACQSREKYNFNFYSDVMNQKEPLKKAQEVLEKIGLIDLKDCYVYELSHGQQRMLEIGIALAVDPILLMLDEPTSGLAPEETTKMIKLIEDIKEDYTILLIEHKMMVVMSVSKKIIVLHQGKVIAEGSPEEIQANEEVQKAYLGGYKESALGS
jgi:branched-chain amino acid transport system ATP-binding protein